MITILAPDTREFWLLEVKARKAYFSIDKNRLVGHFPGSSKQWNVFCDSS